ncbi:MAG: Uma2 family endonuclease [Leptolyngbyaceae cyanobacterium SM1_3_5]|nr:Uma2 family endonuclease [Leptolyngbyaceae cyanobacterium SM1_3_5]
MTQTAVKPKLTFEEYIDFCAQTEERYELVRGELVKVTPPTWLHMRIARLLEQTFNAEIERLQYDWEAFREPGQRTEADSSRLPDVMVVPLAEIEPVLNQTAVLTVPAPIVVEIVSPSSATQDYKGKLKEYEALQVIEYWVVDPEGLGAAKYIGFPKQPTVSIYRLVAGKYTLLDERGKSRLFRGGDRIKSPTFPAIDLTAEQVLRGTR